MKATRHFVLRPWSRFRRDGVPGRIDGSANGAGVSSTPSDPYTKYKLPRTLNYPTTTLGCLLRQTAKRYPDLPAVGYGELAWTYRDLLERVNRLAAGMADMGVGHGDRVVLTLPNCPEFIAGFLAIQRLGAVVVNAGPLMGVDDLRRLFAMTHPKLVMALDLQAPQLETAAEGCDGLNWLWASLKDYQPVWTRLGYRVKLWQARQHLGDRSRHTHLDALLESAPPMPPTAMSDPDDVAVLQPTGGTTGSLKVARLTHRNVLANATQLSVWASLQAGQERVLGILPMFHVYGLSMGLVMPVFTASQMVPMTRFRVRHLIETLEQHRPTLIPLVPAILEATCDLLQIEDQPDAVAVMRRGTVMSGAAPLNASTSQRFEDLTGVKIVQGYGLTEASPVTHANPLQAPRVGSIGLPLPDTHVRVMSVQGDAQEVKPGDVGELLISGPQVFQGYLDSPEETRRALSVDENGRRWLHTGDVVRVDEDGYYYVMDRKKHMINRGGLKVYPRKVEVVLAEHDKVADVAVVGRPDRKHTETVVAVVVPEGAVKDEAALAEDLRVLCRERLAPYEVPSVIEFATELPRSALGKLLKHRIGGKQNGNGHAEVPAADVAPSNGSGENKE